MSQNRVKMGQNRVNWVTISKIITQRDITFPVISNAKWDAKTTDLWLECDRICRSWMLLEQSFSSSFSTSNWAYPSMVDFLGWWSLSQSIHKVLKQDRIWSLMYWATQISKSTVRNSLASSSYNMHWLVFMTGVLSSMRCNSSRHSRNRRVPIVDWFIRICVDEPIWVIVLQVFSKLIKWVLPIFPSIPMAWTAPTIPTVLILSS